MCEPRFFAGSYPAPRAKDVLCHRCADDGAECSGTSEGGVSVSSHAQCRSKVDRQLGSVSRSLRPRPQICCSRKTWMSFWTKLIVAKRHRPG